MGFFAPHVPLGIPLSSEERKSLSMRFVKWTRKYILEGGYIGEGGVNFLLETQGHMLNLRTLGEPLLGEK